MQLFVHRFLDFRQLGLIALADFLELRLYHRPGRLELDADLFRGFALTVRQGEPQLPLFAR